MLNSSKWRFTIIKEPTKINLYTGTIPYERECFEVVLGDFECRSELEGTRLKVDEFKIKLLDEKILELQGIRSEVSIKPDDRRNFNISVDIFAENAGRVTLSRSTVHYISTLKQLRNDWLILFGFYSENIYDDDEMLHKK